MKLISMTSFVIQEDARLGVTYVPGASSPYFDPTPRFSSNIIRYARFLSQPIKLEMFAPVDKNGQVLPEVKLELRDSEQEAAHCYLEAMGKVLFKDLDIEYTDITKKIIIKKKNGFFVITGAKKNFGGNLTIEDLVHRDLELTDNALKLIGV